MARSALITLSTMSEAYFCLVTWPDGTEGLLFPRPGNVPINTTLEEGLKDFETAREHLDRFIPKTPKLAGTTMRLVKFERVEVVKTHPEPPPATPLPRESIIDDMYKCGTCGRHLTHSRNHGYICEYCAGIED
jgi:hypothetical protein